MIPECKWQPIKRLFRTGGILAILISVIFTGRLHAQMRDTITLPDFSYKYQAPEPYHWKRIGTFHNRVMFGNSLFEMDSVLYSFGGFDTVFTQRELNVVDGSKLRPDYSFHYPGRGFFYNICWAQDSFLFLGGGHDSSKSFYAEQDFWKYNWSSQRWTRLKDLPFYYSFQPCIFNYKDQVFACIPVMSGPGFRFNTPTLYHYDLPSDTWLFICKGITLPTSGNANFLAFILGDNLYTQNIAFKDAAFTTQFYRCNLENFTWTRMADIPGSGRDADFALSDGRYAYVGSGGTSTAYYTKQVFRYDPFKDLWEEIHSLPHFLRRAQGWCFKGKYYVGFGINDRYGTYGIWQLIQDEKED